MARVTAVAAKATKELISSFVDWITVDAGCFE
jgi:hypothetical protein